MKNLNQNNYLNTIFSPIGLLIGLTLVTFLMVIQLELDSGKSVFEAIPSSLSFWQSGFFNLLAFTLQMMMVLAFGYALAIFRPINKMLKKAAELPHDLIKATLLVSGITMLSGLINWGFGLVIGAIFSRMVHESLVERGRKSNPELLAACGYLGMAVWHGGLSASSLLSIAEKGHSLENQIGVIPIDQTIFSYENLIFTGGLILVFILVSGIMGKYSSGDSFIQDNLPLKSIEASGEDRLAKWVGIFILLVILSGSIFGKNSGLSTISLNWVIFLLFGTTLVFYKSWGSFLKAMGEGLKSTLDIFIQFPFYGGIMGLILSSGLLISLSDFITEISGKEFFPLFAFYSSALVNFFIPSGGGQWAVQGPLLMKTAEILELSYAKMALVFAYGDQITNLLQPFWALPLLAITGVSVRKLLPYCLVFFLAGFIYLSMMIWILI
ncbi:TIGR00366 family protein [Algoriphagus boseongensis]|uniref:TIGR00366 family protein n=1 Tax=Algoriphagus boseongensis TaxID=1442587 RepID=UPI001414EA3F|nr:TIGR00366 family protein [Algoriphagus boseongensis]